MAKVIITADSTADLSEELKKEYDIKIISLYVNFNEQSLKDGVDITTEELYQKVKEVGYLPKTQAISPGDFVEFFKPLLQDEEVEIVHISIGSLISASVKSALIAKDLLETERIHLVDSHNLSSGIGLLVLKACDFRDQGLSAADIKSEVDQLVPMVRSQFAIRTLDYLHKGGRASGLSALIGGILQVKPIIKVTDGKLSVYKKSMGKMTRALDIMIDDLLKVKDRLDLDYIFITHSLAESSYHYMYDKLKGQLAPKRWLEGHAGCVISSHCGEGTIGVLYIVKPE